MRRTLYYLTASILGRPADTAVPTLEACIRQFIQGTGSCRDRMHSPIGDTITKIWLNRWHAGERGISGVVVVSDDGMHRRRFDTLFDQPSVDMAAVPAGEGKEWESGSILFFARGNDLMLVQSATVRAPTLRSYFTNVFRTTGILTGTESIDLQAPVTMDVLKHLKGVKRVTIYQVQESKPKTAATETAPPAGLTVVIDNPLLRIRQGLSDLVQREIERVAAASALDPSSLRYELNITLDRRATAVGGESLKQIASTLLTATGGDPTSMEMAIETASTKIRRNVVSQRTDRDILRDASMMPDLIDFHRTADRWLLELDSVDGEGIA